MRTPRPGVVRAACSVCLLWGALACTSKTPAPDDSPVKTVVQNTEPTGTVSGEVRDLATGNALDGVVVTLLMGAASPMPVTTLADGLFTFASLPAGGSMGLTLKKAGYFDARVTVQLDDAAGNFPSANNSVFVGPVHLVKFGDTPLKVEVLRQDGTPALMVPVFMDLPAAFFVAGDVGLLARGNVHEMITTDMTAGLGQFATMPDPKVLATRFPGLAVTLTVGAIPGSASDPGSDGQTRSVPLTDLLTGDPVQHFVLLPSGSTRTLEVLASGLPDLLGGIRPQIPGSVLPGISMMHTSFIRVVFNQAVALNSVVGTLVTETGEPLAGSGMVTRMAVWRPSDTTEPAAPLTGVGDAVDLIVPALPGGVEANLVLSASAARGGAALSRAVPIYVRQEAALAVTGLKQTSVDTGDALLGANEGVDIILNQAVGARHTNGTAVGAAEFQKVLVQLTQPGAVARMECLIQEPTPPSPYVLGGFTTRVHCTLPGTMTTGFSASAANTVSVRVDFNDAAQRDGGSGTPGAVTAVTADGTVAVTASGTPALTLLTGG